MKEITLEEALKLVSFHDRGARGWKVLDVNGNIYGDVKGYINGNIKGNVRGTINGRSWEFIETPKEKLQRLIAELGNQELIDTFNQMEDN